MKKIIILMILAVVTLGMGCSKSGTSNTATTNSSFQGAWSGQFTGSVDNGTWVANISSTGVVSGTAYSNIFPGASEINGTVTNQGAFNATVGRSSDGARFSGNLSARSGSGTWVNTAAGINGNWTGTKQ